jgi:anti-anti-sigma factor
MGHCGVDAFRGQIARWLGAARTLLEGETMPAAPPQPQNPIRVEQVDGVTAVRFKSSALLGAEIELVAQELQRLVAEHRPLQIVVNLGGVTQLSSNMLATLVSLSKGVADGGGKLVLCELTPQVYELLKTTRLENRFRISDEEADALAQFGDLTSTPK